MKADNFTFARTAIGPAADKQKEISRVLTLASKIEKSNNTLEDVIEIKVMLENLNRFDVHTCYLTIRKILD